MTYAYQYTAIKELTQQICLATLAKRREQLNNAERLQAEIVPNKQYPYSFICFRLTDYRTDAHPELLIVGEELKNELSLLMIQVERSIPPQPIESLCEEALTLDAISKEFNVSTKTIGRWRLRGLVARRVKSNGRSLLVFPRASVTRFAASHKDRVAKSSKFCHLSDSEKESIILQARTFASIGESLTDVSKKIAADIHRSAETVRYTIKNFDRDHPTEALYPMRQGPLNETAKEQIFNSKLEGASVETIAKQFGRTRSSVYRVANEVRVERLLNTPVDYMHNAEFDDPKNDATILGPMPDEVAFFEKIQSMRPPKDIDPQMAYLYEKPLLTREQEAHLFRKMNYRKHKLHKLREKLDPARARVQDIRAMNELIEDVKAVRDLLIECNQRLVHSLATKHMQSNQSLDELKSDANISVMRAVEKFDYSRGNKFSTYATWAVMKNFARSIPDENTRRTRYVTGADELFDAKAYARTDEQEIVALADAARNRVNMLLEHLDPRTRDVIRMRTGLAGGEEMTLEQIGQHFGITKERVRQINVRGMKQLREWAAQEKVELP